jgi:hypothetical protein
MPKCIPIYIIGETGGFNSWRSRELERGGGGISKISGNSGKYQDGAGELLLNSSKRSLDCMYVLVVARAVERNLKGQYSMRWFITILFKM